MTDAPIPRHTKRLGNLDLLRLLAALMVVVYHYTYSGAAGGGLTPFAFPELVPFTQSLWAGVSLFFMISGFVIAYSAERAGAYDFAVARAARLYPGFIACMSLTALVLWLAAPAGVDDFGMTWPRWMANLTMVPFAFKQTFVDGVYWSIVVEVTFYAWVALFIACGVFRQHQLIILAVWLVVTVGNELWLGSALANKLFITRYACYFVLGILSYRIFAASRRPSLAELVIGLAALLLSLKSDHHVHSWMQANYTGMLAWSAPVSLAKTCAFLVLLHICVRVTPILPQRVCTLLGGLTYPLYLLHASAGFVLFHHLHTALNRWAALALVTALMLALSYLVYRFVEPAGRKLVLHLGAVLQRPRLTAPETPSTIVRP
jgi:peptidoglycan/LPS O-acetylase OafA/YrhL